jgi:hypothetical protein
MPDTYANRESNLMKRRVAWLSVVAIGAIVALTWFLSSSGPDWSIAIQGTATVVLAAITGAYAYLTFKLVRAQEMAPRSSAWIAATRRLTDAVTKDDQSVRSLVGQFPIDVSGGMALPEFEELETINDLASRLYSLGPQLPPSLFQVTFDLATALLTTTNHIYNLQISILREETAALRQEREPTWDGAKSVFYMDVRDATQGRPEWEDLLSGKWATRSDNVLGKLLKEASEFLQGSAELK